MKLIGMMSENCGTDRGEVHAEVVWIVWRVGPSWRFLELFCSWIEEWVWKDRIYENQDKKIHNYRNDEQRKIKWMMLKR